MIARLLSLMVVTGLLVACTGRVTEDDPRVVDALEAAAPDLEAHTGTLVDHHVIPHLPAGARVVAERSHRFCSPGQHNWKIQDPYDLTCSVGHEIIVAVPTNDDWRDALLAIHRSLAASGLEGRSPEHDPFGLAEIVNRHGPRVESGASQPGLADGTTVPHGPQHFPGATYLDHGTGVVVGVSFTGPDDRFTHARDTVYTTSAGAEINAATLVEMLPRDGYGLSVRVNQAFDW